MSFNGQPLPIYSGTPSWQLLCQIGDIIFYEEFPLDSGTLQAYVAMANQDNVFAFYYKTIESGGIWSQIYFCADINAIAPEVCYGNFDYAGGGSFHQASLNRRDTVNNLVYHIYANRDDGPYPNDYYHMPQFSSASEGLAAARAELNRRMRKSMSKSSFIHGIAVGRQLKGWSTGGGGYPEPTGTINITSNGTYNVKDKAYAAVSVSAPSGSVTITDNGTYDVSSKATAVVALALTTKQIIANGTYLASADAAKGFATVEVNVPNSYTVADEGKVVYNGALYSQTPITLSANGTYDTTLNNSVTVNVTPSFTVLDEGKVVNNGVLTPQTSLVVHANGQYNTLLNDLVTVDVTPDTDQYDSVEFIENTTDVVIDIDLTVDEDTICMLDAVMLSALSVSGQATATDMGVRDGSDLSTRYYPLAAAADVSRAALYDRVVFGDSETEYEKFFTLRNVALFNLFSRYYQWYADTISFSGATFTPCNVTMSIFNAHYNNAYRWGGYMRFYGMTLLSEKDYHVIGNYVPVRRVRDGQLGIYDRIADRFFAPLSGTLTARELPAIYRHCDYIGSSGAQFIDTGVYVHPGYKIEVKFRLNAQNATWDTIYGCRQGTTQRFTARFENSVNGVLSFHQCYNKTSSYSDVSCPTGYAKKSFYASGPFREIQMTTIRGRAEYNHGTAKFKNVPDPLDTTLQFDFSVYLFALNNAGVAADFAYADISEVNIWDSDSRLIRSFVPCYRLSDGKPGMYEFYTDTFFTNSGTGEFTIGVL